MTRKLCKGTIAFVLMFACVFFFNAGNTDVKALVGDEVYGGNFQTGGANISYAKNTSYTIGTLDWTASVSQISSKVFYLGANATHIEKGKLGNIDATEGPNSDGKWTTLASAIASVDSTYDSTTEQAYALMTEGVVADISEITFEWVGGNAAFKVYLFVYSNGSWILPSVTPANGYVVASSGTTAAGSVTRTFDESTSITKVALVARHTAVGTLRVSNFSIKEWNEPLDVVGVDDFCALNTKTSLKLDYNCTNLGAQQSSTNVVFPNVSNTNVPTTDQATTLLSAADSTKFSIFIVKEDANTPAYNTSTVRLYGNASEKGGKITINALEGRLINSVIIEFVFEYDSVYAVSPAVTATTNDLIHTFTYETGISEFTIQNVNTTTAQVRIKSIAINYTEDAYDFTFDDVAMRFGTCITKANYDDLMTNVGGVEFGVAAISKTTLGESNFDENVAGIKLYPITPVRVAYEGAEAEDLAGDYYQFAVKFTGITEENFDTEIVAASYVKINGIYYFMKTTTYSVKALADAYLTNYANDTAVMAHKLVLSYIASYTNKMEE